MPLLRVRKGESSGAVHPVFTSSSPTTLGRQGHADIGLDDAKVSRRHASLQLEKGAWVVEDLKSSNGTFLAGERITRSVLDDGAIIQVGGTLLSFHARELLPPPAVEIHGVTPLEALREESGVFVWRARQAALDREVRCDWLHPSRAVPPVLVERLLAAKEESPRLVDDAMVSPMFLGATPGSVFSLLRLLPDTLASRWEKLLGSPLELRLELFRALLDAALERAAWSSLRVPLATAGVFLEPAASAPETWRLRLPAVDLTALVAEATGDLVHLPGYAHYLPPELARGDGQPGKQPALASTMYSAGAMGYHLLTGHPPMGSGSVEQILNNHQTLQPAPASLVSPAMPASISNLLDRLLAKDPHARPRGRVEALEPFQHLPRRAPPPVPAPAPPPSEPVIAVRPARTSAAPEARKPLPPRRESPAALRKPAAATPAAPPATVLRSLLDLPLWLTLAALCFFLARHVSRMIFASLAG